MFSVLVRRVHSILLPSVGCLALALHMSIFAILSHAAEETEQTFTEEQIEQLVAPIALHPDALLTQILMASTYPLEIVQAARWVEKNPKVAGKALEEAMTTRSWDPSVKSLAAFPQVLEMLNDDLSWTQQLGDAFLAQQEEVLDAVQKLRARADKADQLKTTKQQTVKKQTVKTSTGSPQTVIVIEQADPEIIYVPAYNPAVVYGAWPYPAYPPYTWYPPGYVAGRVFWFATGVAVGHAIWGRCDWGRRNVNININRYNSFSRTNIKTANWKHNPRHRRGVPYHNRNVSKRYGGEVRNAKAREQFRGRAQAGRRDLARERPDGKGPALKDRPKAGKRPAANKRPTAGKKPGAQRPAAKRPAAKRPATKKAARPASRPQNRRKPVAKKRPAPTKRPAPARRPSAYRGMGQGHKVREHSNRGRQSRQVSRARPSGRAGGARRGGRR